MLQHTQEADEIDQAVSRLVEALRDLLILLVRLARGTTETIETEEPAMRHFDPVEIAKLFSEEPEVCRHLAETCPTCGERFRSIEALMQRFEHWNPEVALLEGPPAEGLFATLLAAGDGLTLWSAQVDENEDFQTWGVAWIALEKAREELAAGTSRRAQDLALLAAKITEHLVHSAYHQESVADLTARAFAIAAAAETPEDDLRARLQRISAAVEALDKGTGDEAVARVVWDLLSRVLR
jgi:hypothetical protein